MTKTAFLSTVALIAALGATGPTLAQGVEHKIGGKVVPAAQIEAVQAKCDELRAAGTASTDASATTDATADTEAIASVDPAAGAETAAETATEAGTGTSATAGAAATTATSNATSTDTAASSTDASGEAEIDLDTLTIEMCDEGGFSAKTM
jgi:hypothetical protein